jgi:chemotaxis protein methyltransferase CheR
MPERLARALSALVRHMHEHRRTLDAYDAQPAPHPRRSHAAPTVAPTRPAVIGRLLDGIERRFGLAASGTLRPRLANALRSVSIDDLAGWIEQLDRLDGDHPEWLTVVECLTVHETYLFRDWPQLELLRDHALPALIADAAATAMPVLRLWSAGCASGEEAFSLAVIMLEALAAAGIATERPGDSAMPDQRRLVLRAPWRVDVLGTDVSRLVLAQARTGVYETGRLSAFRAVSAPLLRFFPPAPDTKVSAPVAGRSEPRNRHVRQDVRGLVRFERFNLLSASPPDGGRFDVVACRNVLVYLTPPARNAARRMLEDAVRPGGILLLGPTDQPPDGDEFEAVWGSRAVVYRRCR